MEQELEQILKKEVTLNVAQDRTHPTIDTYTISASVLYTPPPKLTDKPTIYDMPSVCGQVHLHENELGITGGRLYPYDRSVSRPINAYEGALLDHYAKALDIEEK